VICDGCVGSFCNPLHGRPSNVTFNEAPVSSHCCSTEIRSVIPSTQEEYQMQKVVMFKSVVPVTKVEAYVGSGSVTPIILNLDYSWR
jgi:hypothetical protein